MLNPLTYIRCYENFDQGKEIHNTMNLHLVQNKTPVFLFWSVSHIYLWTTMSYDKDVSNKNRMMSYFEISLIS